MRISTEGMVNYKSKVSAADITCLPEATRLFFRNKLSKFDGG